VIDLQQINHVTVVDDDKNSVEIGPGSRWERVYSILDAQEIGIPGGRVSTVSVRGLITGGGISFFSPRYGWVFDSVEVSS
jgi:FAD/FMN-containing dehydrogenase